MIDICMTATLRPSLVSQTLDSFCKNVFRDRENYRLVINIDPIGEEVKSLRVLEECKKYFGNVVFNVPQKPCFATAVLWCWNTSSSDFIFHLEDDWLSTCKINVHDMVRILKSNEKLACLRLSKYDIPKPRVVKLFGAYYEFTGDNHFITTSNNQFGLNPVLIKKNFVKSAIPLMRIDCNPEKQFRPSKDQGMTSFVNMWQYGLYGCPGSKASVVDNGARWRERNRFRKPSKNTFLVWERF